jgi:hypothetical protein
MGKSKEEVRTGLVASEERFLGRERQLLQLLGQPLHRRLSCAKIRRSFEKRRCGY